MTSSHATWRNPRILAMLLMVFLAGGLVGAWTMRHDSPAVPRDCSFQPNEPSHFPTISSKIELNLSPEQAQKLKSILDDFVKYNHDLQSQIEDYRATGKNRIRSILNAQQQQQFEKLCDQIQTRN